MKQGSQRSPRRVVVHVITAALMSGAIVAPSISTAAEPAVRYDRQSKKAKAKSELLDTKFSKAKEAEEKKARRGVQMMSGDEFAKKRKAVEQEIADKQIDFLKRLVKTTPKNDPEYADYLFRLADHHLEKKAISAYTKVRAGSFDSSSTTLEMILRTSACWMDALEPVKY